MLLRLWLLACLLSATPYLFILSSPLILSLPLSSLVCYSLRLIARCTYLPTHIHTFIPTPTNHTSPFLHPRSTHSHYLFGCSTRFSVPSFVYFSFLSWIIFATLSIDYATGYPSEMYVIQVPNSDSFSAVTPVLKTPTSRDWTAQAPSSARDGGIPWNRWSFMRIHSSVA
ncbi:hypothetical protein BKA70DRAFT_486170 [Coprinopsis sp. MPI-PUGE-AT-0042]|nr:hypothetical protein BKA70DRAFT_486170 [Coprinopsis sp. MPI-PUGE-AT-0042]